MIERGHYNMDVLVLNVKKDETWLETLATAAFENRNKFIKSRYTMVLEGGKIEVNSN